MESYAHTEKPRIDKPNQENADGEIINDKTVSTRQIAGTFLLPEKLEQLPQALHTTQERCSQPEAVATRKETDLRPVRRNTRYLGQNPAHHRHPQQLTILKDGRQKSSTVVRDLHRGQPHLRGEIARRVYLGHDLATLEREELLHLGVQSIKSETDATAPQLHRLCAAASRQHRIEKVTGSSR